MNAFSSHYIPDFSSVVETGGHELVTIGIEVETDDLSLVSLKVKQLFAVLHVPEFCRVVHRTCGHQKPVRVETQTHDLHAVAFQRVHHLTGVCVPNLGGFVEGPSHYEVAEGVVEGHRVDHVLVLFQVEQLVACLGVPHLACSVVGTRNELVAALVECAVGKRQQVSPELLEQREFLLLIFHLFLDEL